MPNTGNDAQVRVVAEQVADAAITRFASLYPERMHDQTPKEAPIPPLIKWLVGAIAGLGSTALIGLGVWLVTSVSSMQETLARMDERQISQTDSQDSRFAEINRRITRLERYHEGGGE